MLEVGQNQYKLIGKGFVIYLKGDGSVDHAAYITAGGDMIIPLSTGATVMGSTMPSDHCDSRSALFDSNENTLWNKMVRLKGVDCGGDLELAADDESIYLHRVFSNQRVSGYSSWLVRLDNKGNLAWSKLVGQNWIVGPFAMTTTADGGLIFTTSRSGNPSRVIIGELDRAGQLVRAADIRPSSGMSYYIPWGIIQTIDGGTILSGSDSESGGWALKLNKKWEIAWQKRYTLPAEAHLYLMKEASDGGAILQGIKDIVKINADGSAAWAQSYGHHTPGIYLNDVRDAGDGGLLVAASLQGASSHHPLSMKLEPDGRVANCDLIRRENVASSELDLVISPATVAMQNINAEVQVLDPGYTGPIEVGFEILCGSAKTAKCVNK
jgi:hypothetical protein